MAGTATDAELRRDSFTVWVAPHVTVMRRVIAARAPGHDVEDLLQDALTRAWQKWHTFSEERGSARSWLVAVAFDRARRASARAMPSTVLLVEAGDAVPDPDADLDLRRAVGQLSPRQREAVVLHYYVDLPVDEVAGLMDCSPGTVKSTLSDARHRLADLLGEDS